jgi:heavy metal sensor kinase
VRLGLPIRLRLALVCAALAVGMLIAGLITVYVIERQQVHRTLARDALRAAQGLATVGEPREPQTTTTPATSAPTTTLQTQDERSSDTGEGETASNSGTTSSTSPTTRAGGQEADDAETRQYLRAREGSDQLLAVVPRHGTPYTNNKRATALWHIPPLNSGQVRNITVGGATYVVASASRPGGQVFAAVPTTEADAGIRKLLDAMLIVCIIGLVPATAAAWLVTRSALSPLSRIAQRASRVTAGDLSVRMGPVRTHDEIADVATAIDGMLDRLEVSFAAQRRFVHDASHELRTPLTIARGHLEVAQPPGDASPELQAAVGVAIDELDRMGRLVDNLLRLARADEGTDHKRTPVDVALLADDLVQRSLVLGDRDWQVHAPTEAIVDGDEDALNEVLLNLVSNAVRHTSQADTIDIRVAIRGDRVTVEVADTGDGIDPELLPTLFDRFTRADSARSRDTGGAGLGLAICRAIVEAHGGTITAESTLGSGATFMIDLPRSHEPPRRRADAAGLEDASRMKTPAIDAVRPDTGEISVQTPKN